jgi:hypothetical protein
VELFAQLLINGIVIGATYALVAIGLTLIFGMMRVVSFAHGEFYAGGLCSHQRGYRVRARVFRGIAGCGCADSVGRIRLRADLPSAIAECGHSCHRVGHDRAVDFSAKYALLLWVPDLVKSTIRLRERSSQWPV